MTDAKAINELDAIEPNESTCPRCGVAALAPHGLGVVQCNECSYRRAFGDDMPRVVVSRIDHRFLEIRFEQGDEHRTYKLDHALAGMLANALR